MADIELVIRIPKEEYELCKKYKGHLGDHRMISDAVANGTPLPKGHGDLIDINDLEYEMGSVEGCSEYDYEYVAREDIEQALVIIEADKEE